MVDNSAGTGTVTAEVTTYVDAIKLLKKDHRDVEALFKQVDALSDSASATRRKLFDQIAEALELHAEVEETILYPAVRDAANRDKEARQDVYEAYEEHALVKELIAKLQDTEPKDEAYKARLTVLKELVQHHVKEEEKSFFPEARDLLGDEELDAIGDRIAEAKAEAGQPVKERRSPVDQVAKKVKRAITGEATTRSRTKSRR